MVDWVGRLRQRKVVQWTISYAAAAFALIQAVDIVSQRFGWPPGAMRGLIVAAVAGVPIVFVLAWYHGDRGRQRVTGVEIAIVVALLAIGATVLWRIAPSTAVSDTAADVTPAEIAVDKASLAVLPLANESGDKDQQYFSDGLSEDLITALSKSSNLKVISRNSSFEFRDSRESAKAIAAKLGVAHLLEGSVRRAGDAVRVRAELVDASTGRTLWSENFDRPYRDLFALQDELTAAVARALSAKLLGDPVEQVDDRPRSGNLDAYDAYKLAHEFVLLGTADGQRRAIAKLDEAIRIDPRYARAHAALSMVWAGLAQVSLGGDEKRDAQDKARRAADDALRLDPDLAEAHVARGMIAQSVHLDWDGAEAEYKRALAISPHNISARGPLTMLEATRGRLGEAIEMMHALLAVDPMRAGGWNFLARFLTARGRYDEAVRAARRSIEIRPGSPTPYVGLVTIDILRGRADDALLSAEAVPDSNWKTIALALARQIGGDRAAADAALQKLIDEQGDDSAVQIAEVYALRGDPDAMFKWLDRAYAAHDSGIQLLLYDTYLLRYKDDPRFAAFARKVDLPFGS